MRRIILFLIIIFGLRVFSQQSIDSTDFDGFALNTGWDTFDLKEAKAEILNGEYVLEHKREESSYTFFKKMNLDYDKDFSIEIALRQESGSKNDSYGIIWGMRSWNDYNSIFIRPKGYYKISSTLNKKTEDKQSWKKDTVIELEVQNVIRIEQKGSEISYYINGIKKYSAAKSSITISGHYFGIILFAEKKIKVRYVKTKGQYKKLKIIEDVEKGYRVENLGENINSKYDEKQPVISADGKTLYFCVNKLDKKSDEITYSTWDLKGSWRKAEELSFFNNTSPNAVVSVSPDNNTLYLLHRYDSVGNYKGKGLSYSKRTESGWTTPQEIKIDYFYYLDGYPCFSVSQDSKYLLMSIEREGSKGSSDIFVSFKRSDNFYSEPLNLGAIINTHANETSPFLAADNKTMYFSSAGHIGYGNNDIFVSSRLDETWTNWSEPKNLGPEINTASWNACFSVPASGQEAYMTRGDSTIGGEDIIKIKLAESARPKPVMLIKGKVLNKKTNLPESARIKYFDLQTKEESSAISNPLNGEYCIILQMGKRYYINAENNFLYPISDTVNVGNLKNYEETAKNLFLTSIELGESVLLNNISFNPRLSSNSYYELDNLAAFLKKKTAIEIELGVHTDEAEDENYNLKISQQQAEIIMNYLIYKGIDKARLKAKGYGKSKTLNSNGGQIASRRVEFTIIK